MGVRELQQKIGTTVDGVWGPKSQAALIEHFTNRSAPRVNDADLVVFASKIGCSVAQIKAVAEVESSGAGFDKAGRPKMLFERHLFHRLTDGKWSPAIYSQGTGGGYSEDSWKKLAQACGKDVSAAFGACSWGRFQVLGLHWSRLGYSSSYDLAYSTVESEAAHYDLLAGYVLEFGLAGAMRTISTDPYDCRTFARGYNGPGYRTFKYDEKLAAAMARLS